MAYVFELFVYLFFYTVFIVGGISLLCAWVSLVDLIHRGYK